MQVLASIQIKRLALVQVRLLTCHLSSTDDEIVAPSALFSTVTFSLRCREM